MSSGMVWLIIGIGTVLLAVGAVIIVLVDERKRAIKNLKKKKK